MSTLVIICAIVLCSFLMAVLVGFLRIVLSVPASRWAEASELSGTSSNVMYGEVKADPDGLRDPRIAKGKVWDRASKQWMPQGKLSDEYLNGLVN